MTISTVGFGFDVETSAGNLTYQFPLPASAGAGDLIVAVVTKSSSAVASIDSCTDDSPTAPSYTASSSTPDQNSHLSRLFYVENTDVGTHNVTATFDAPHTTSLPLSACWVLTATAGFPADPLDGNASNPFAAADTSSPFVYTITTDATASLLAVGQSTATNLSFEDPTPAEGWNDLGTSASEGLAAQDLLEASAGTYTASWTNASPPTNSVGIVAAFVEDSGSPSTWPHNVFGHPLRGPFGGPI